VTGDEEILDQLERAVALARLVMDGQVQQVAYGEVLRLARLLNDRDARCPYTFSHTKHWCGYEDCRDS